MVGEDCCGSSLFVCEELDFLRDLKRPILVYRRSGRADARGLGYFDRVRAKWILLSYAGNLAELWLLHSSQIKVARIE